MLAGSSLKSKIAVFTLGALASLGSFPRNTQAAEVTNDSAAALAAKSDAPSPFNFLKQIELNRLLSKMESGLKYLDPEDYKSIKEFTESLTQDNKLDLKLFLPWKLNSMNVNDFGDFRTWLRYKTLLNTLGTETTGQIKNLERTFLITYLKETARTDELQKLPQIDSAVRGLYQVLELVQPEHRVIVLDTISRVDAWARSWDPVWIKTHLGKRLNGAEETFASSAGALKSGLDLVLASPPMTSLYYPILAQLRHLITTNGNLSREGQGNWVYHSGTAEKRQSWQVEINVPISIEDHGFVLLRHKDKADCFKYLSIPAFFTAVQSGGLNSILENVAADYSSERDSAIATAFKQFDLPATGKITHLRYFTDFYDGVVSAALKDSMLLARALELRYGSRVQVAPVNFAVNPKLELIKDINAAGGADTFFIDLYCHGSENHLAFRAGLTARDIVDVAKLYPRATFVVNTLACHGGGLREGMLAQMKNNPELAARITVLTQSKPDALNYLALTERGGGSVKIDDLRLASSLFMQRLILNLLDREKFPTFGAAQRDADLYAKKHGWTDAEVVYQGKTIAELLTTPSKPSHLAA